MSACVFCDIVNGQAPAKIVETWDGTAIAIVPLNPVVEGHLLVLPIRHVTDAGEEPYLTSDIMGCASWLAADRYAAYNLITSAGEHATQSVFHLHIHVVPRREGDGLHLPWTGQVTT
jgi:histidine triad (HIT) family protein